MSAEAPNLVVAPLRIDNAGIVRLETERTSEEGESKMSDILEEVVSEYSSDMEVSQEVVRHTVKHVLSSLIRGEVLDRLYEIRGARTKAKVLRGQASDLDQRADEMEGKA